MTIPKNSSPLGYGTDCTCPAKATLCNLTDCPYPWAARMRASIRPSLCERIASFFVWYFNLWRRWERR